ncbi:MAG TPA: hypothetical protein VMZ92_21770 [Planctomycetota bacterium]|nr:hypothetical protein [Planctomycetota bacterium]
MNSWVLFGLLCASVATNVLLVRRLVCLEPIVRQPYVEREDRLLDRLMARDLRDLNRLAERQEARRLRHEEIMAQKPVPEEGELVSPPEEVPQIVGVDAEF